MFGFTILRQWQRGRRIQREPLAEAVTMVTEYTEAALQEVRERIKTAAVLEAHTPEVIKGLLPIEAQAREDLEAKAAELRSEKERLRLINKFGATYKQVSLEPLTWRDENGLPLLVVFSLDSPEFVLHGWYNSLQQWAKLKEPQLPEAIQSKFADAVARVQQMVDYFHNTQVTYTCRFAGVIPQSVKANIQKARRDFHDDIFIIAEAGKWTKRVVSTREDPLVVGWDGHHLWLIDVFDVTPVEAAMAYYPTAPTDNLA